MCHNSYGTMPCQEGYALQKDVICCCCTYILAVVSEKLTGLQQRFSLFKNIIILSWYSELNWRFQKKMKPSWIYYILSRVPNIKMNFVVGLFNHRYNITVIIFGYSQMVLIYALFVEHIHKFVRNKYLPQNNDVFE